MAEIAQNSSTEAMKSPKIRASHGPLLKQLGEASAGLNYVSETDAPILPFDGGKVVCVSKEAILRLTALPPDSRVEERDFSEFFDRLTVVRDWFGKEKTAAAKSFLVLRELMERNLRDLTVYRIGLVKIEIYAVGIDKENNLTGIRTKAVET